MAWEHAARLPASSCVCIWYQLFNSSREQLQGHNLSMQNSCSEVVRTVPQTPQNSVLSLGCMYHSQKPLDGSRIHPPFMPAIAAPSHSNMPVHIDTEESHRHRGKSPNSISGWGQQAGTRPAYGWGRQAWQSRWRTWTVWDWMLSTRPVSDGSATDRIGGRAIFGCTAAAALLLRPLRLCSSGAHPNASLHPEKHGAAPAARTEHGSITPGQTPPRGATESANLPF